MGFTNPYPTPKEKGIVGKTRIFDNTLGGSIGKIVAVADNQIVEGILWMETGLGIIDIGDGWFVGKEWGSG